jgi:hypothetical protein
LGIAVTGAPPTGTAPTGATSAFCEAVLVVIGVAVVVVVVILAALDFVVAFAFFALVLRVTMVVSGLRTELCMFRKR